MLPQPLLISDQILNIIFVVFPIILTSTMIQTPGKRAKQSSLDRKALRQKRDRRRLNIEKKLNDYSKLCGADACFGIRIRESGQVFIFSADDSGFWTFLTSHLVCLTQPWSDKFAKICRTVTMLHRCKGPKGITSKYCQAPGAVTGNAVMLCAVKCYAGVVGKGCLTRNHQNWLLGLFEVFLAIIRISVN
jgi:hypothetical protein